MSGRKTMNAVPVPMPTTTEFSPLHWALYHPAVADNPTKRLVLLYLADGCTIVRPTTIVDAATLARLCGCSAQTAWTCLTDLERAGVIRRSEDQTRALIQEMRLHTDKRYGKNRMWEWECLAYPSQHRRTATGAQDEPDATRTRRTVPQHDTKDTADPEPKGHTR